MIYQFLKNTSDEVKELVLKINELDKENKLKFINYIFDLLDKNQINSLNEVNPNLLDDGIDIEIFNPSSIDYRYLVIEIKEYCNYTFNLYRLYPKEYKKMIRIFERLSFKEKKDVIAELLPDSVDGYEITGRIIKY